MLDGLTSGQEMLPCHGPGSTQFEDIIASIPNAKHLDCAKSSNLKACCH